MKRSAVQFASALKTLDRPGGKQLAFLRAHYRARGRALTANLLAEKAGYKHHGGINVRYGLFAKQIGMSMGVNDASLSLLVDFAPPKTITNKEGWGRSIQRRCGARS